MAETTDCVCGAGEAEEDRGAVLRCAVHGPEASRRIVAEVEAEFGPVPRVTRDAADREAALEEWAQSRADWSEPPEVWDALLGRDP